MIKTCGLRPLLHGLTDTSNFDDQVLVSQFLSDFHTARHATHLDGGTSDTSVALSVVLIDINTLISDLIVTIDVSTLVELLSLRSVALIFNLRSKLTADKLLALWGDLLG